MLPKKKIENAKYKFWFRVPGDDVVDIPSTTALLNQALFFSSVQSKHDETVSNVPDNYIINPFVKSRNGLDFYFSAVLGPMFVPSNEKIYATPDAVKVAIKNAKNGTSSNVIPSLRKYDFSFVLIVNKLYFR